MESRTLVFNPVLTGFHADPSILRVGDTYYIANSTFEWFPGVEIHRSKDLANWESVPSPLSDKRLLDMAGNRASCGIWAPCLSYHDGTFYLIYTNTRSWDDGPWKDSPNYLTTAEAIEGPWSKPVFLNCSGFDASLFHDDDGKHYLVNMEWDYRKDNHFTGILLQEYSPSRKKLLGKVRKIYTGTPLRLTEGPHLYKRGDYYYLVVAEGGTQYEHAVTVARSKSVFGPYETHPANPLLTSNTWPEWPIQKAGHASMCDSPDGRTFMAFLCGRPLPETRNCPLGRETAITELEWKGGWPYVKYEKGLPVPSTLFGASVPNYPPTAFASPVPLDLPQSPNPAKHYTFDKTGLSGDFKTLRVPAAKEVYSLSARPGFLRLRGGQSPVSCFEQTLLASRQTDFSFDAETYVESDPKSFQEFAGLTWRYDEANQYLLSVSFDEQAGKSLSVHTLIGGKYTLSDCTPVGKAAGVYLGLSVRGRWGHFRWSPDGKTWVTLRPALDAAVLSDEFYHEGFTGAFCGMFCVDTAFNLAHADFKFFDYKPVRH